MKNIDRYTCALIADYAKKCKMTRFVKKLEKVTKCQNIVLENVTLKEVFQQYKNRAVKQDKYTEDQKYSCALIAKYSRNVGMHNFAKILEEEIGCQGIELDGVTLTQVINQYKMTMNKAVENLERAFVMDYCKQRGMHQTVKALEEEIGCQKIDLKGATLVDVIENYNSKFKCSRKRKAENDILPKIKRPKLMESRDQRREVSENSSEEKKFKLVMTNVQYDDIELDQLVPIRSIFTDKTNLEDLKDNFANTELVKVAEYIFQENISVKNALSLTISLKHNIGKAIEKYPFLKTTKLCGKGHGPSSEASVILDSWNMLVKKVPIFIPEKFIKDIERTTDSSCAWVQSLIGTYLSQNISDYRCAIFLYKSLISLILKKGTWTEDEDEELLTFIQTHNGKPSTKDLKALAFKMDRSLGAFQARLAYIKGDKHINSDETKGRFVTIEEDRKMLEYLDGRFDISSGNALKSICQKNLQPLAVSLQRGIKAIFSRFTNIVLPIMLGNLYCATNIQWEKEFFKFIIENQVKCISDVDWSVAFKMWPFLTKPIITRVLDRARKKSSVGLLYQQISEHLHRIPIQRGTPKYVLQRKHKIIEIHDELLRSKLNKNHPN